MLEKSIVLGGEEEASNEEIEEYLRALESLSDAVESGYFQKGKPITPEVARKLLTDIARTSETVDAILRHMTNDIANAGFRLVAAPGVKDPSNDQYEKLMSNDPENPGFFNRPNPEDTSNEWLEDFVWDLLLHCDAYWEKVGDGDEGNKAEGKYWFGGDLIAVWQVGAENMKIIVNDPTGQMSTKPGDMCYQQKIGQMVKQFDARKIIRVSRFRKGRLYGQPGLLSLLDVIAGQINLTGYIGNLYNGNIPKTLINVGKMSREQITRMNALIQKQMNNVSNSYGMVALNVPGGFELHKLMDSAESGKFIETLKYYREEICSVFGMPPSKMGWATPGKIGSQDHMDDTYYDNIERIQDKIEKAIYRNIILELECPDWMLKFNQIRPKQIKILSESFAKYARAGQVGRQEQAISVNTFRKWYQEDPIDEAWANDPRFPSPVLEAKKQEAGNADKIIAELKQYIDMKLVAGGQKTPTYSIDGFPYNPDKELAAPAKNKPTAEQVQFAKDLKKFQDGQEPIISAYLVNNFAKDLGTRIMKVLKDARKIKKTATKAAEDTITMEQYTKALSGFETELKYMSKTGPAGMKAPTKKVYQNTITWVGQRNDTALALNKEDLAVLKHFQNEYFPPMFKRLTIGETPYNYKNTLNNMLTNALTHHHGWPQIIRDFNAYLSVNGNDFPRWMYTRVIRTELNRFVTEGHLRGHKKLGFKRFRRLVTVDKETSVDFCLPYENYIYKANEASGVVPAHPNSYAKGTEAYTADGWKPIEDMEKGELVLSLNPETFDLEYVPVTNLVNHYQQEMISFKSHNFDLLVTPNHQMFTHFRERERSIKRGWHFCDAVDIPDESRFYRSSQWVGHDIGHVHIGKHKVRMDTFCKFMGIYLSEGSFVKRRINPKHGYRIDIAQSKAKHPREYAAFLKVIESLGVKIFVTKGKIMFSDKDWWKYLKQFGHAKDKFIPTEVKDSLPGNIKLFLDYFLMGDGHERESGFDGYNKNTERVYASSSKHLVDGIGELIIKIGHRPSYTLVNKKGTAVKFRNGTYKTNSDVWVIRECRNQFSTVQKNGRHGISKTSISDYNDNVYCVELERHHTLLVRYNGKVTWCGNCRCDLTPEPEAK